jgi:hypothetical protein
MAKRQLINMLQQQSITGVALNTYNTYAAGTYVSIDMMDLANCDAAVFYVACTAAIGSGTIAFTLQEATPISGTTSPSYTSVTTSPSMPTLSAVTTTPTICIADPFYPQAARLQWVVSGFTSVTIACVAMAISRGAYL